MPEMRNPPTKHVTIRVPLPLYTALAERAQREDRSISSMCRRAIADTLASPAVDARIRPGGDAGRFEGTR